MAGFVNQCDVSEFVNVLTQRDCESYFTGECARSACNWLVESRRDRRVYVWRSYDVHQIVSCEDHLRRREYWCEQLGRILDVRPMTIRSMVIGISRIVVVFPRVRSLWHSPPAQIRFYVDIE